MKNLTMLIMLLCSMFLLAGCGGGDESNTSEASSAQEAAPATESAPAATEETVAARDCDGPCGMKDVPVEQLTEFEGKYFCAGCIDKAKDFATDAAGQG